jgi:hypothetical protein
LGDPYVIPGAVNRRLGWAREQEGLSMGAWRDRLAAVRGYSVSRSSVAEYEWHLRRGKRGPRMPPADYVASVSEVFGYRLEWLLLGRGETKDLDGGSGPESEDQLFEGHLFGDLPRWMKGVAWASGSMRISLLRLLSEVDRALAHVPGITGSEGRQVREAGLKSVVSFLNAALPGVDDS